MPLLGRARYNLLRQQTKQNPEIQAESWEVRDYRDLSLHQLFHGLSRLGVFLTTDTFEEIAKDVDTPEELTERLGLDQEAYLYIFELWRRLLDNRKTISVFCDELDFLIDEYEQHPEENEEMLVMLFAELLDILDVNVESGYKPKQILKEISNYFAHDLVGFLLRCISSLIDRGNTTFASELLDDFSEYLEPSLWIDFLRLKLLHGATPEVATAMMARFLEKLKDKPDIELYFHLLKFLIETGDIDLFTSTFRETLKLITTEDHFLTLLGIVFDYFNRNDREKEEELIKELIAERKNLPHPGEVLPTDKEKISSLVG